MGVERTHLQEYDYWTFQPRKIPEFLQYLMIHYVGWFLGIIFLFFVIKLQMLFEILFSFEKMDVQMVCEFSSVAQLEFSYVLIV